jgi:hypothetical protein
MNEARETWPLVTAASSGVSPSVLTAPRRGAAARDCWLFVSARTSLQNLSWPWMQAMWRQVFP